MKSGRFLNGQEIQSDEAVAELLKYWKAPEVTDNSLDFEGRSTAMGTSLEDMYFGKKIQQQPVEEPEEIKPLTIQEIETIRQDAYEEGFNQGKEEGYPVGFDEGKNDGVKSGFDDGLEQGKEQGIELAQPIVDEKLQTLQKLIDELQTPLRHYDDAAENQLVQLATMLAEAVIFTEVKTNQNVILSTLKQCIDALPVSQQKCEIQLHPDDLTLVESSYGEAEITKRGWILKAEPSIEMGGCIINTINSSVDFSLKTRIQDTLASFLQSVGVEKDDNLT